MQLRTHLSVLPCLLPQLGEHKGFGEESRHADFKIKVSSRCPGTFLGYFLLPF
jgi:hypothetical protein